MEERSISAVFLFVCHCLTFLLTGFDFSVYIYTHYKSKCGLFEGHYKSDLYQGFYPSINIVSPTLSPNTCTSGTMPFEDRVKDDRAMNCIYCDISRCDSSSYVLLRVKTKFSHHY